MLTTFVNNFGLGIFIVGVIVFIIILELSNAVTDIVDAMGLNSHITVIEVFIIDIIAINIEIFPDFIDCLIFVIGGFSPQTSFGHYFLNSNYFLFGANISIDSNT